MVHQTGKTGNYDNSIACSLPPPPAMLSQEHQGPGETSNPELPAMSKRETIGLVSGWHPDMPRKRALKEAYSTIFVL